MDRFMPRSPHSLNTAAAEASARSQACWLRCWEPTWNETPCGSRPGLRACSSTSTAIAGSQPNLRDSGHSAPTQSRQDAAEHLGAGRRAGDLLDFGLAVDRVEADAERVGARDVALLLDRVAVGDAVGRGAGGQHHLDLGDRGGVEAGAELGQQRQHFRRRVGLHRVEHAGVGQGLGEGVVVVAHDVEVDDKAGPFVVAVSSGSRGCAQSLALFPYSVGHGGPGFARVLEVECAAPDGYAQASDAQSLTQELPWIGRGCPVRTAEQR